MVRLGTSLIITMNKAITLFISLVVSLPLSAQFVLGRQTMSCFSMRACDELCINSTAGQIDFGTMTNSNTIFTSGFEQTEGAANLYLTIDFRKDECSGAIQANILQTFGCEAADSIWVFWDNSPSDFSTQLMGSLHMLRLESNTGCSFEKLYDFQELSIPVTPCALDFYNYISPNGDGSNDAWVIGKIDTPEFLENEVVVFNRWGGEVWSCANYNNDDVCFKGIGNNGKLLPDGTYFYQLKTQTGEFTGYIELLR